MCKINISIPVGRNKEKLDQTKYQNLSGQTNPSAPCPAFQSMALVSSSSGPGKYSTHGCLLNYVQ